MAEVKVLIEGNHKLVGDNVYIGSTVTLVQSEGKNIIIDTGHLWNKDDLIKALDKEQLKPEDIDIVILTHTHLDHTANTHLFKNAKIFAKFIGGYPGQYHNINEKCIERYEIKSGIKITRDVEYLFVPGHSVDMLAIIIETDKGKFVISGDAIASEEWTDTKKQPNPDWVFDIEKYNKSRDEILKIADYIVPGHGKMFKVEK